jgi:hypothetical protein
LQPTRQGANPTRRWPFRSTPLSHTMTLPDFVTALEMELPFRGGPFGEW